VIELNLIKPGPGPSNPASQSSSQAGVQSSKSSAQPNTQASSDFANLAEPTIGNVAQHGADVIGLFGDSSIEDEVLGSLAPLEVLEITSKPPSKLSTPTGSDLLSIGVRLFPAQPKQVGLEWIWEGI
jgi:hypothetical protein